MTNPEIIDIRQESILPMPFRVAGYCLFIIGLGLFLANLVRLFENGFSVWIIWGFFLAIIGFLIGSSHYRLMIDPGKKEFNIYVWLMGFKQGKPESFRKIDMIYINRTIQSTRVSSYTGHPHEMKEYLYKAFMKMDNGEKIHLDSDKDRDELLSRTQGYVEKLNEAYPDQQVYPVS